MKKTERFRIREKESRKKRKEKRRNTLSPYDEGDVQIYAHIRLASF